MTCEVITIRSESVKAAQKRYAEKHERLYITITREEKEALKAKAEAQGMSVAAYIKSRI